MEDRKTPEQILEEADKDITASTHEWANLFRRTAELYRESGDLASAEMMQSLRLAFGAVVTVKLERFSVGKPRFIPIDVSISLNDIFPSERCQHLRGFLEGTNNIAIRAHLFDLIWEVERDHIAARAAIDAYLELAAILANAKHNCDFRGVPDALLRSLEISIRIRDTDRSKFSQERILDVIRSTAADGTSRNSFELVRELLTCKLIRNQLPIIELRDLIEKAIRHLEGDVLQQRHWEQLWLENLERLGRLTRDSDLKREARIRIGESHEQIGDFWTENGSCLPAIPSYQCAITSYRKAGKCPEKIDNVLKKLGSTVKASHTEMKELKVPVTISSVMMEQWHTKIISTYKSMGLGMLADPIYVLPDIAVIRSRAAKIQSSVLSLWPAMSLQENRVVHTAEGQAAHIANEITRELRDWLSFNLGHITKWVFDAVREEEGSLREKVFQFIAQSRVIDEQRYILIDIGLERYEAGDYISSIHILVFQIEGILRDFLHILGQPTTNMEFNGQTPARLLGDLLRDDRLKIALGDTLTESLKAILADSSGLNIRNLTAHGLASSEMFTEHTANILIALLLQVSALKPKESEFQGEVPPDK